MRKSTAAALSKVRAILKDTAAHNFAVKLRVYEEAETALRQQIGRSRMPLESAQADIPALKCAQAATLDCVTRLRKTAADLSAARQAFAVAFRQEEIINSWLHRTKSETRRKMETHLLDAQDELTCLKMSLHDTRPHTS